MIIKSSENSKRKRIARRKHEDRISQLPDDILIPIISHLNVKEAAAISILTPRWRYLHTYTTCLNFPSLIPKLKIRKESAVQEALIRSFPDSTNTINRVLDSHKGRRVKEFRVHMFLWEGADIKRWLEFALAKDVEIIHIHMDYVRPCCKHAMAHYSLRANLNLMGETLICLKELSLLGIEVNDEDVHLLLDKFPLLESLSIRNSYSLRHVSIVGHSSSKLKHLEINRAIHLQSIEIDNFEKLVSIWCALNSAFSLNVKNVPKLSELSMSDSCICNGARILSKMSSSIHDQLRTLKIFTHPKCTDDYRRWMPELIGVKNLELQHCPVNLCEYYSFDPFYIFRACPSLETLQVKFLFVPGCAWEVKVKQYYEKYNVLDCPKTKVCPNLTKMKISDFIGSQSELEFVFSILKHLNTLEELVVETCDESKKIRDLANDRARSSFRLWALKVVVDGLTLRN